MERKKKIGVAAGVLVAAILAALGIYKVFFAPKGHTQNLTDPALSAGVVADYTKDEGARSETFASGSKGYSWENGDPFNVWWKAENAVYDGGKLTLKISEMTQKEQVWNADGTSADCLSEYYGAEVRSEHYYGYGDFQVRMKPAAIPGTASTFFTCTGPYDVWYNPDGSVQRTNDHDEIDIEFLGKDTTKVQFNYFASGKGGHEYMYDLGFDASKDFHNYGYRWSEESITWFVDDKPVYKVLRSEIPSGEDWPEDPGRIVMNYWCGTTNAALWMGDFKDDYSSGAEYEWIASSAEAQPDPSSTVPSASGEQDVPAVGDQSVQVPDTEWAELDMAAFDGWGKYTVDKNGGKVTIAHDKKLQKYDCCGMDLNLGTRNKVSYTVTNTGIEKAFAKVSIKNTSGDNSAITCATINGSDAGYYEYGVLCELAPGESADVVMLLDLGQKPSQVVVSLNSEADSEGKALRSDMPTSGKIVLSGLKAVKSDETTLPGAGQGAAEGEQGQQPGAPKAPEGPVTEWAALDMSAFDGWGKYTVAKDDGKVTVSHGKKLQKYDCCGMDLNLGTRNKVSYTVTNTGTEKAYAKVSIKNTSVDNSAITSATINGSDAGYYEYGVLCELAPGESADVVMLLDLARKPSQVVVSLNSEADSEGKAIRDDMPKSGKIVISDLKAVKSGETTLPGAASQSRQTTQTQPGEQPKAPDAPVTELAALDLNGFDGWGKYAVSKVGDAITVSHDKTVSMYDCCGTELALGERNKVQFTLANNGSETAFAKVNLKDKTDSTGVSSILTATVNGAVVDYVEYGVLCALAPGQSAQVEIYADGVHPADQLVLSLNSEGDSEGKALRSDMPSKGSVTLSNLRAVKTDKLPTAPDKTRPDQSAQPNQGQTTPTQSNVPDDQWADVDLKAVDGWGKYTVTKTSGAVTVSHDKTVAMYDCCGGEIALGSRNKVKLTLTNEGKEKAFAKININDKTITTGLSSIQAATINGADAGYIEYGVLCELAAGESAQVELLLTPGKAADQLVVSLNSEGDAEGKALRSDMPSSGKVTVSNMQAVKTEETRLEGAAPSKISQADVPLNQWLDVDLSAFDGWGMYTVEKTGDSVTMAHDKAVKQYACAGMNYEPGERNKVRMTIKNNGEHTAEAKVSIKSDKVDTSAILGATIDGRPVTDATYGVMCKIPAGKSVKLVVYLDLKKDVSQLVVSLNSEEGYSWPTTGNITVSKVQAIRTDERYTKATGPSSGGGGGGGGGGAGAPAPATPDGEGKLILAPSSGSGWNSTTVAAPAEDGGVTLSHTSAQGVYGNFSWPVGMNGNNKMELDVTNNADVRAYAKVSLTTEGDDSGRSVLASATVETLAVPAPARFLRSRAMPGPMQVLLRAGGPEVVEDVTYGVLCELEPHESAHVVMLVKPEKLAQANKLVVSLNSEGTPDGSALDPNMPATGSITLKNIVCGEYTAPVDPEPDPGPSFTDPTADWELSLEDWSNGAYTLTNAAGTVGLSHAAAVDNWTCVGKAGIDFGDAESLMFTVTNNDPTNQAKLQFNVVNKAEDNSETKAATAATVTVDDVAETLDVSDGVIFTLAGGKSGVVRVTLDPAANANQIVVFLNSMQPAGTRELAETGDVTISETKWDKTTGSTPVDPEPGPGEDDPVPVPTPVHEPAGEGWTDISLAGAWSSGAEGAKDYTLTPSADNMALTVSHQEKVGSGACAGKGGLALNGSKELEVKIKNNADTAASVKVNVRVDSGDSTSIVSAKINGTNFAGDPATDWGVSHALAANGEAVFLLTLDDNEAPDALTVSLNSNGSDMPAKGSVSIVTAAYKTPGGEEPDPEPEIPEGWEALDVSGWWVGDGSGYSKETSATMVTITHSANVNGWANTGLNGITGTGDATALSLTIQNTGSEEAKIRLDLRKSNSTIAAGSASDGTSTVAIGNEWGGSEWTLGAGETKTYTLTPTDPGFDEIHFYLNSLQSDNTGATTGSITITNVIWQKGVGGDDPAPETPEGWEALDVSGWWVADGSGYSKETSAAQVTITHSSNVKDWKNTGLNGITSTGDATALRLAIKNNGSEMAKIRLDLRKSNATITAGTASDGTSTVAIGNEWGGSEWTLGAGETKTYTFTPTDPGFDEIHFYLNSLQSDNTGAATGSITISGVIWQKPATAAGVDDEIAPFAIFDEEENADGESPVQAPAPQPNEPPVAETPQEEVPEAAPPAAAVEETEDKTGDAPSEELPDEPVADEPVTNEPVVDKPVADEPPAEEKPADGEDEESPDQPDRNQDGDEEQDKLTEE